MKLGCIHWIEESEKFHPGRNMVATLISILSVHLDFKNTFMFAIFKVHVSYKFTRKQFSNSIQLFGLYLMKLATGICFVMICSFYFHYQVLLTNWLVFMAGIKLRPKSLVEAVHTSKSHVYWKSGLVPLNSFF